MHYYKFNIADWAKETGHLSLKEEAILLRLINWYLDYESPIPVKTQMVLRKLRLADESDAVDMLLNEFFTKTQDGWRMKKLDKTVDEYQAKAERNRKNGKSGGRPKNNDLAKPTGLSVDSEKEPSGNLNQEPLTKNQEPITNNDNKENLPSACADSSPKQPREQIDFSPLCMTDDQIDEVKRIRRKNKGGAITQRVVNGLAKEFEQAARIGWAPDDILNEWELRGWKSFKAEWIKPKDASYDGMSAISRKNAQNLAGDW